MDVKAARFGSNLAALKVLMAALRAEESEIRLGGGAKAAEAQKAKGRLTVRERLKLLLDEGSEFLELGLWAAHGMYGEYGGAPAAGVVTGRVTGLLAISSSLPSPRVTRERPVSTAVTVVFDSSSIWCSA